MDNNDEMMMELMMQDEANVAVNHLQGMMLLAALLLYREELLASPGWFKGWEGEEQESTATCGCPFA
jgi:hypothetical protein